MSDKTDQKDRGTAERVADGARQAVSGARRAAEGVAAGAKDAARAATEASREVARGAREAAADVSRGVREAAHEVAEGARGAAAAVADGARGATQGARAAAKPPARAQKAAAPAAASGGGKAGKGGKKAAPKQPSAPAGEPRLKARYRAEVVGALMSDFAYPSAMQVPRLVKITLNAGLGRAVANANIIKTAQEEMAQITGQRPVVCRARRSIANFKLREGQAIGCMVTLRRERMWEFFDRLVMVAIPRIRDFHGLNPRSFDGRGNYNFSVKEQLLFPEIVYDKVTEPIGMSITFTTTAKTDAEGRALLTHFGMPFRT